MKKLLIILIFGLLTGCAVNNFKIGKESNIMDIKEGISLTIKEGTLTKTGATLILKNEKYDEIQYGAEYEIEIKKNNKWYKIDALLNFILPLYVLNKGSEDEFNINWENGYGKLKPGEYRILKNITAENKDKGFESFYVSADFIIE